MTPRRVLPFALSALFLAAAPASAQDMLPFVVEPRAGVVLPLASFRTGPERGGEIGPGATFGVHFVYRNRAGWGPYLGFSQDRFDCAADGCPGGEYVSTRWDLGAQRTVGRFAWIRAGILFARLERSFVGAVGAPEVRGVSSLSAGAEGGAGLRIPMRGRMSLTPGARYGWLNTRFRDDGPMRMRWLTADLGLAIAF